MIDIGYLTAFAGGVLALPSPCSALLLPSFLASAVGMTIPLFVVALLWQRFDLGHRQWLRGCEYRIGPLRLHTTSTLSGLLFVGVGLLFLLADGTAGLLGADPAVAQAGEDAAVRIGSAVPDVVLLGGAVLVVVAVAAWQLRRRAGSRR